MMATSTSKGVRVAAGIVCAIFAAFVLIHLLWAVGITWGLNSALAGVGDTEAGIALTAVSLVAAARLGLRRSSSRSLASAGSRHDSRIACSTSATGSSSRGRRSGH